MSLKIENRWEKLTTKFQEMAKKPSLGLGQMACLSFITPFTF